MKEYIEREAAKKMMARFIGYGPIDDDMVVRFGMALDKIPTADVVEVQDALALSQTFNLDEYREKEDQRDCDFVFGVLMRLGIVCLKMYDPITRTMKFWVEKMDGGADDAAD